MNLFDSFYKFRDVLFESPPSQLGQTTVQDLESKSLLNSDEQKQQFIIDFVKKEYNWTWYVDDDKIQNIGFYDDCDAEVSDEPEGYIKKIEVYQKSNGEENLLITVDWFETDTEYDFYELTDEQQSELFANILRLSKS